jgi:hemoglobin
MLSDREIHTLVRQFYDQVRLDPELAPIFARHIKDWPSHLAKMDDFWSSVANTSGRYKGHPMMAHMKLDELEHRHFARWLDLFRHTATKVLSAEGAAHVITRAERIAESFKLGLDFYRKSSP